LVVAVFSLGLVVACDDDDNKPGGTGGAGGKADGAAGQGGSVAGQGGSVAGQGGSVAGQGAIPDNTTLPGWCNLENEAITEATPTSIRFKSDLNGDGDTLDAGEDVRYYLTGNTIMRQDGAGTPLALVTGVPDVGLSLQYYDVANPPNELVPSGGALSQGQRNCVAKVRITVQASLPSPDPTSTTPLLSTAALEVAIRNRSQNNF